MARYNQGHSCKYRGEYAGGTAFASPFQGKGRRTERMEGRENKDRKGRGKERKREREVKTTR
jgi:hypothetical protein